MIRVELDNRSRDIESMNFLNKFLKRKRSKNEAHLSAEKVEQIVGEYGKILQTGAPMPGCVSDVKNLPYTKEDIKTALIITIKLENDESVKEMLKACYIQLADWQENVGSQDIGMDISDLDMSQDATVLAQKVLERGAGFEQWKSIIENEMVELMDELKNHGL